jgi:hypothetical protein
MALLGNVSTRNGRLRKPCFFLLFTGLSNSHFDRAFVLKRIQGFRIYNDRAFVSILTELSYQKYTRLSYHFGRILLSMVQDFRIDFNRAFVSLLQDYRNVETISVISSQMLLTRFRTEL